MPSWLRTPARRSFCPNSFPKARVFSTVRGNFWEFRIRAFWYPETRLGRTRCHSRIRLWNGGGLAVAVSLKRRDFDNTGRPDDWFPLFRHVEAGFPVGLYRASDLSRMIVSSGVNYDDMRSRRLANLTRLRDSVRNYALFPDPEPDLVPCGFPVRVDPALRDRVVRRLHGEAIYVPVHWPIEGIVPAEFHDSHELTASCITLLCDQRYTPSDMDRQTAAFLAALR